MYVFCAFCPLKPYSHLHGLFSHQAKFVTNFLQVWIHLMSFIIFPVKSFSFLCVISHWKSWISNWSWISLCFPTARKIYARVNGSLGWFTPNIFCPLLKKNMHHALIYKIEAVLILWISCGTFFPSNGCIYISHLAFFTCCKGK